MKKLYIFLLILTILFPLYQGDGSYGSVIFADQGDGSSGLDSLESADQDEDLSSFHTSDNDDNSLEPAFDSDLSDNEETLQKEDSTNLDSYPKEFSEFLEEGEKVLEERISYDDVRELFTEIKGKYYRKFIKDNQLIKTESVELMPAGLKTDREKKDENIGKALSDKLGSMGINTQSLPSQLDYSDSPYLPPVGRQYEDSCVGWAAGYYLRTYQQGMDIEWSIKDGEVINPSRVFSPSFIYNQINGGVDGGAYMEDAGQLIKTIGASPLEYFPYIPGDFWTQPGIKAIEEAYPHRIKEWKILYTNFDSTNYILQKTKEYLNTGDLMIAGISVGFKFSYPYIDEYGNAIITTDNTAAKGHAVVVVGYDNNIETPEGYGAFKIINSYGQQWGNDGFAYMTYGAFVENMRAGYVFTDLINTEYLGEVKNIRTEPISPTKYRLTFDELEGAEGYRLLNENKIPIAAFSSNEYMGQVSEFSNTTRYIQGYAGDVLGEMTLFEVDTRDIVQELLNTEILEGVSFDLNFSGFGMYDLEILNEDELKIYEKNSLLAYPGLNTVYWKGLDLNNNEVEDGQYIIKLLNQAYSFSKESKLTNGEAYINKLDEEIKSVDINLFTKRKGTLDLYLESKGNKIPIHKGLSLEENQEYNYNIDILKYVSDLEDAQVLIEIY